MKSVGNRNIVLFTLLALLLTISQSVSGQAAWTSSGPTGGYVNTLSFSTCEPGFVYAGTISGVYKSIDGGEQWSFAGLGGIDINKVLVDPENAGVVYAGVGRIPGYQMGEYDGLYKSTDGGESWTKKYETWVTAIAIDPASPNTIYMGTKSGEIIKSQDGGTHWTLMHQLESSHDTPIEINAIQVDPEVPSTIFATVGSAGYAWGGRNGLLKSTDAGETWKAINIGRISPNQAYQLIITPAGHAPQALYAIATGEAQVDRQDDVYVSIDKGETWTALNVPVIGRVGNRSFKVQTICIDFSDPDWIGVGTTNPVYPLIAINIREQIWADDIGNGLPESAPACLAVNPLNTDVVLAGYKDGMLYRSTDHAGNWKKTEGVSNSRIIDLAIHPEFSNSVYAVVDGHRPIQKTEDGGAAWDDLSTGFPENFSSIAIDPSNPLKMFVGEVGYDYRVDGRGYISRTEDGGENWDIVDSSMSGTVHDIWIHPTNPDIILALKENRYYSNFLYYGGLRRSVDGGDNWTQIFNWGWPNRITSDPNNHDHVYIGVERMGYVLFSPDAGETWDNISPGNIWYNVYDVVVDSNSNLYTATSEYEDNEKDGIWKMEWDGDTSYSWSHMYRFEGTRVTSLAIDHRTEPAILYAGTSDLGVYVSEDGGDSWEEFNDGLAIKNITRLEISATEPKMLYAGTVSGGVWATPALSLPEYLISVLVEPEGEGTVTGDGSYYQDNQVTLTASPATGYHFVHWTENGAVVSDNPEYTFTATEDRNLLAHFAINIYLITATAGENGSISPAGETEVEHGSELVIIISPDTGYRIAFVMIDGVEIDLASDPNWDASTGQYTFSGVTEAHTIEVGFEVATDIAEAEPLQRLTVYPNPAKEELWVAFFHQGDADVDIVLLNLQGQVVQQVSVSASGEVLQRMATHGLAPGMYLLTIRGGEVFPVKKVVIEK